MREQQAKDFWSVYLKLILRKGQETTIVNPFEEFRDSVAKGGYESVSDEEYANIYDQVEELSVFWQQRPKDSVAHIVIEALSRTHLYEDEIQDIAGILAEASERTNYTQQMLQEMGAEKYPKSRSFDRGWMSSAKRIICFRMEAMLTICLMMCRIWSGNTKICGRIRLYRSIWQRSFRYAGSFRDVRMRY